MGATIEQDDGEIEYVVETIKETITPYLLPLSFLGGISSTVILAWIISAPCDESPSPVGPLPSVASLIEHHILLPGDFPALASNKMINDVQCLIQQKDAWVVEYQRRLAATQREMDMLCIHKAQEIKRMEATVREAEKKVSRIEMANSRAISDAIQAKQPSPPHSSNLNAQIKELKRSLEKSEELKKELENKVQGVDSQITELNRENSGLREEVVKLKSKQEAVHVGDQAGKTLEVRPTLSSPVEQTDVVMLPQASAPEEGDGSWAQERAVASPQICRQRIQQLENQLSVVRQEAGQARQLIVDSYQQKLVGLESRCSDMQDGIARAQAEASRLRGEVGSGRLEQIRLQNELASARTEVIRLQDETGKAEAERARREDEDAKSQAEYLCNQTDLSEARAENSRLQIEVADAQVQKVELENRVTEGQNTIVSLRQEMAPKAERLAYLESQCKKADQMWVSYQEMMAAFKELKDERDSIQQQMRDRVYRMQQIQRQLKEQARTKEEELVNEINALQTELEAAKKQIREDANRRSAENDPTLALRSPLVVVALEEKEQQLKTARGLIDTLNNNLVATRRDGGPSAEFLRRHESLQQDRKAWIDKYKALESKFFSLENNARRLSIHEERLIGQLVKLQPGKKPDSRIPLYKSDKQMYLLHELQAERDALTEKHHELEIKSQATLEAALAAVDWQLGTCDVESEAETQQKCSALDEEVQTRVRTLLEKIRWKLQTTSVEAQLQQEQRSMLSDLQRQQEAGLERGQADKRKERGEGHEMEGVVDGVGGEEIGDEERRKRQQHEHG